VRKDACCTCELAAEGKFLTRRNPDTLSPGWKTGKTEPSALLGATCPTDPLEIYTILLSELSIEPLTRLFLLREGQARRQPLLYVGPSSCALVVASSD
jgi:hypothetical protein